MFKSLKTGKGRAYVGVGIVLAIAIYISAKHIYYVSRHFGQAQDVAFALPGILDIFAFFCASMIPATRARFKLILLRTGMWFTLITSMWFNIMYALIRNDAQLDGWMLGWAIFISWIPSVIVALAAEILTRVTNGAKPETKTTTPSKAPSAAAKPSTTGRVTAPRQRKPKPAIEPTELVTV